MPANADTEGHQTTTLLAHPELVEQHSFGEAVLAVPKASGNQINIGLRGQRDGGRLLGWRLVIL
jgi:hypothetical protein